MEIVLASVALANLTGFLAFQHFVHCFEDYSHALNHSESREAERQGCAQRGVVVQGKFPKSVHIGGK